MINKTYTFNLGQGPYLGPYFEDVEFKRQEEEKAEKERMRMEKVMGKETYGNPNVPKFQHPEEWISTMSKKTSEAVITSVRFIENQGLLLENACFCECMAYGAEACCLVAAFRLRWAIAIEMSEESRQLGWSRLSKLGKWAIEHTEMCVSRLHDHLAVDADIAYLDTEHLGPLDEGPLICKFLQCSRRLLSGSYLILLTRCQVGGG